MVYQELKNAYEDGRVAGLNNAINALVSRQKRCIKSTRC